MLKMLKLTLTILACLLAAWPTLSGAKNIYKYQDEDGIWHFTDRAPNDETEFETVYMEREPEPRVRLRQEGTKHSPVYFVHNDFWGPVEIELRLKDDINVLSEPQLPARFVIPGQKEQVLVGIGALDPKMSFQYRLGMVTVPGKPIPEPITGLEILPPIAADEAYLISQGFLGDQTHNTPDSEYAIDIAMPVGTAIHAVRSGIVMDVEEDFNKGGTDRKKFIDKANHVRIVHPDGTMALYAHLDLASVIVRPGARVRAGQKIASSGNTGFSMGPHLHFAIQQNTGLSLVSLPFKFKTPEGTPEEPGKRPLVRGTAYTP